MSSNIKKINVVGLGYVGLPAALQFVNNGYEVVGTDLNESLLENLRNGRLLFDEEGMEEELLKALENKIEFKTNYVKADMYVIAVPTHFDKQTKKIDPVYLIQAVNSIIEVCEDEAIIVVESTISPGTIEKHLVPLAKGKKIHFAHAPERIIPGKTLEELINNDRVIGADDLAVREIVKSTYKSFCEGNIRTTDLKTAEMTKVVENTFRDVNIAYANELKKICQLMGLEVQEVIELANNHPRVNILNPSPGVGGHCIPVDPWFLVGDFPQEAKLIYQARENNDSMPIYTWNKLKEKTEDKEIIGVYGLTYKGNIDDIRESPALQLLNYLEQRDVEETVYSYDPFVKREVVTNQVQEFDAFLEEVDAILVMAPHDHLKEMMPLVLEKGITIYDPFGQYDGAEKI